MTDLYRVLGASPHATHEQLHQAFRARARRLHPDVSGDEDAMRELNDAWAVLGDPELRAEYDEIIGVELGQLPLAPGCVRRAPVVAILVVLLVIFVLTAYVAVPTTR